MFGSSEMIIVLVIVLVLFGGSQLPKLAKNLGKAQKEFKDGIGEAERSPADADRAALPRRSSSPPPPPAPPTPSDAAGAATLIAGSRRSASRATRCRCDCVVAATLQDPASFAFAAATPHPVLDPLVEGVLEAP